MGTDIIDTFDETTGAPALAFIGYLESILTDDIDGMSQFEKTFGRYYMGIGAMSACVLTVSTFDRPEYVLLQIRQVYAGFTTSPTRRASQRFIEDLLDVMATQQTYDDENDEYTEAYDLHLTLGRTPRVKYLRALAAVAITLLATVESHADHTIAEQMIALRRHFLSSPA